MKALGVVFIMAACSSSARQSLTPAPGIDGGQVSLDSGGVPDAVILDYGGPDTIVLDGAALRDGPSLDSRGPDLVTLDSTARTERPTVEVKTTDGEAIDRGGSDVVTFDGGAFDSMGIDAQCPNPHTIAVEGNCMLCGNLPGDRCCAGGLCDNGAACINGVCGVKS